MICRPCTWQEHEECLYPGSCTCQHRRGEDRLVDWGRVKEITLEEKFPICDLCGNYLKGGWCLTLACSNADPKEWS